LSHPVAVSLGVGGVSLYPVSVLALTYDDGPDRELTGPLLDLLAGAGATATFFPIAPRASAHPELIARMLREGHTVGLHCEEHVRHSERDRDWCRRDADRGLDRLRALGVRPRLWRTPWDDRAPWTAAVAAERGLSLAGWSADTHDWRGDEAETMFEATRPELGPGAVVLAHDGIGPGALRPDTVETLRYTGLVIDHARETGLRLEALQ
jgi:peptidoglycan/xylan/chitin deacetylase (PgdA/CDA1 family)